MQVTGRFSPHPRGFGFVEFDAPQRLTGKEGRLVEVDSVFVAPDDARGWIAGDVVTATVTGDELDRFNATELALQHRPRRFVVGRVATFVGRIVVELDPKLGVGQIEVADNLQQQLRLSPGQQVVVMVQNGEDGSATASALVAGPTPAVAPAALRARAVVIAWGGATPDQVPGGPAAVGLDPVEVAGFAMRAQGRMAAGDAGLAAGLDVLEGPVPGVELELHNLRHEMAVTIDDDKSRDLDDALVAGWDGEAESKVLVSVHIADVAGTVGIGSEADRYARTMASSAYFVHGQNAPMLDPALSEGELSLLPHEPRRVMTVTMSVAPDGTVGDIDLHLSWIDSHARLSYEAVEHFLADRDPSHLVQGAHGPNGAPRELLESATATVSALAEAARRLGVERDGRDTLETLFEQATLRAAVLDGKIRAVEAEPHPEAQRLVERLMVAANEVVAGWAAERDLPLLYRAHVGFDAERLPKLEAACAAIGEELPRAEGAEPTPADLLRLVERLRSEGREEDAASIATVATGVVARASYSAVKAGHGGLGSGAYTHFTSPIRRYADLVVHRQLRAALAGEELPYAEDELTALATWLDARAGAASFAEALERNSLWAVLLDRGTVTWPAEAIVTGVSGAGLRVRLPEPGVGGFVSANRALGAPPRDKVKLNLDQHELATADGRYRVGQRIKVRLDRIDDLGRPELQPA